MKQRSANFCNISNDFLLLEDVTKESKVGQQIIINNELRLKILCTKESVKVGPKIKNHLVRLIDPKSKTDLKLEKDFTYEIFGNPNDDTVVCIKGYLIP